MKSVDFSSGMGQLCDALETLQLAWSEVGQFWNDENSRNLEEHHLKLIGVEAATVNPAIQHLAAVLVQAKRECGEW